MASANEADALPSGACAGTAASGAAAAKKSWQTGALSPAGWPSVEASSTSMGALGAATLRGRCGEEDSSELIPPDVFPGSPLRRRIEDYDDESGVDESKAAVSMRHWVDGSRRLL